MATVASGSRGGAPPGRTSTSPSFRGILQMLACTYAVMPASLTLYTFVRTVWVMSLSTDTRPSPLPFRSRRSNWSCALGSIKRTRFSEAVIFFILFCGYFIALLQRRLFIRNRANSCYLKHVSVETLGFKFRVRCEFLSGIATANMMLHTSCVSTEELRSILNSKF